MLKLSHDLFGLLCISGAEIVDREVELECSRALAHPIKDESNGKCAAGHDKVYSIMLISSFSCVHARHTKETPSIKMAGCQNAWNWNDFIVVCYLVRVNSGDKSHRRRRAVPKE